MSVKLGLVIIHGIVCVKRYSTWAPWKKISGAEKGAFIKWGVF